MNAYIHVQCKENELELHTRLDASRHLNNLHTKNVAICFAL